ncbi:hypothetical protein A148_12220 [Vibrio splendidus 1F-157]|nr:hypothetical protein A148_12220 [Vibrio splendidus 1F-157]
MKYFFVSKPIQYLNAINIIDEYDSFLLVSEEFSGSRKFFENVSNFSKVWFKTKLFSKRIYALLWLVIKARGDEIFVDSDYGKDSFLLRLLILLGNSVYTYEEGVFTYNPDLFLEYESKFPVKIKIFRWFGLKKAMGLTKGLSGTYVYNPCLYIDKRQDAVGRPFKFKRSFVDNYYYYKDEIDKIFEVPTALNNIKVDAFYCGPKHLSDIQSLERFDCKNIMFKPHPGCNATYDEILDKLGNNSVQIISNNVPIEVLCLSYLNDYNFTFFHHNCSAEMYLSDVIDDFINLD